jgi:hypothetical protein
MARGKYHQGIYKPKNPKKYKGDSGKIIFRSSWERVVFCYLDAHDACLEWSSEETIIPYRSPVDNQIHRYFVDIKATFKLNDGKLKTYLIEIKPYDQTQPPKETRNKRVMMESIATYAVNQSKWEAARKVC